MNDPETLELIQQEIDGENRPDETARLRDRLTADPDARDRFEEFATIAAQLDSLATPDPPAGLADAVVSRIRAGRNVIPLGPAPSRTTRNGAERRRVARWIFAAAAAVVIGLVLSPLVFDVPRSFRWTDATGSMMRRSELLVRKDVPGSSVHGTVELRSQGNRIAAVLDLESAGAFELEMRFDPARLAFEGVHRRDSTDGPLSVSAGLVTIHASGAETATVVLWRLAPNPGAIRLTIRSDRETLEMELPAAHAPK